MTLVLFAQVALGIFTTSSALSLESHASATTKATLVDNTSVTRSEVAGDIIYNVSSCADTSNYAPATPYCIAGCGSENYVRILLFVPDDSSSQLTLPFLKDQPL